MAGNVIVVSGGLNAPITAGGVNSNGASFPIKYFLLAYDPRLDTGIHGSGVTSATPFSATTVSGDTSLIARGGGHYIFSTDDLDYTISSKKFLVLSGAEVYTAEDTILSNSDKANALPITLVNGRPLLSCISASNDSLLYPTVIGSWNKEAGSIAEIPFDDSSYLTNQNNYFKVVSYYPIINPVDGNGSMRGVYKCRVNASEAGEFKFNKVGLYILPPNSTTPVLVAVAGLDSVITKKRTGTSISNVEFDIELEFHLASGAQPIAYMTTDYWSKIPEINGYGLFTDKNVVIGTSGQGWPARKAKLEVVTMGEKPALCLHNRYNENYMLFDVLKNDSGYATTTLSGSSYLKIYTDAPNSAGGGLNVYVNRYIPTGGTTTYARTGIYTSINSKDVVGTDIRGNVVSISNISDVKVVKGFESNISEHISIIAEKTYGYYSVIDSTIGSIYNCDKYGYYAKVNGNGKSLYGVYAEVNPSTSVIESSYAGYFKSPFVNNSWALNTYGNSYFFGTSQIVNNYDISKKQYAVNVNSTGSTTDTTDNIYGLYSKVIKNSSSKAYAGYFESNDVAIYADGICYFKGTTAISADGNCNFNGSNIVNGYLSIFNSSSDDVIFNVHGKSRFFNDITVTKKILTEGAIGTSYFASMISVNDVSTEKRPYDKTGFITPVGSIVAWATATPPDGWLICNGQVISASNYSELVIVLGLESSSAANKKVPDYRGMFLRGLGTQIIGGVTYASEGLATSGQMDAFQSHKHYIDITVTESGTGATNILQNDSNGSLPGAGTNARESTETRPVNKAVNWIIKY